MRKLKDDHTAEKGKNIFLSKALEDRLNDVLVYNSIIETPLSKINSIMIKDIDDIGLQYLLNYQTQREGDLLNALSYSTTLFPYINEMEPYRESKNGISLEYDDYKSELSELLNKRRSIRDFSGDEVSFKVISNILLNAGNIHKIGDFFFRNIASGGGFYPIDIYFYANNVENLEQNIYKFNPMNKNLEIINSDSAKSINSIFSSQSSIQFEKAAGIIFFVFDYIKPFQKYGDFSLSFGFIEVGMISQTIHLLSTLYGVGVCDIGGFDKPSCESLLKVDGLNKHVIHAMVLGSI